MEARQLLLNLTTPSIIDRRRSLFHELKEAVRAWEADQGGSDEVVKGYRNFGPYLNKITQSVNSIFEELATFMGPDQVCFARLPNASTASFGTSAWEVLFHPELCLLPCDKRHPPVGLGCFTRAL